MSTICVLDSTSSNGIEISLLKLVLNKYMVFCLTVKLIRCWINLIHTVENYWVISRIVIWVPWVLTITLIFAQIYKFFFMKTSYNSILQSVIKKSLNGKVWACLPIVVDKKERNFHTFHSCFNLLACFTYYLGRVIAHFNWGRGCFPHRPKVLKCY